MKWNYLILLFALAAGTAQAKTLLGSLALDPYIGIEYQYEHIKGNSVWTEFMPANLQDGAVFLGNKYHKNFGIEIGYYHHLKKSQGSAIMDSFGSVPANGDTLVVAQMYTKGFSIEWDVYYPWDPNFNVFGLIGLVSIHPSINITTSGGTNLATALRTVKGNNRTVLRLGCGAEYVEKNWGARGKILWDHTQTLYVNVSRVGNTFTSITPDAFKQAVLATVGVFYRF